MTRVLAACAAGVGIIATLAVQRATIRQLRDANDVLGQALDDEIRNRDAWPR